MNTTTKTAYRVVGRINGKPAGFVGMYRGKEAAQEAARKS